MNGAIRFAFFLCVPGLMLSLPNCAADRSTLQDNPGQLLLLIPRSESLALPPGAQNDYEMLINDIHERQEFSFQSIQNIRVQIQFNKTQTSDSNRTANIVQIREQDSGRVAFKSIADASGRVAGEMTLMNTVESLNLEFGSNGKSYSVPVSTEDLIELNRDINMLSAATDPDVADTDSDGVPDTNDDFPEDPDRASIVNYPSNGGEYTLAFEDLYPVQGDADFNDYVAQIRIREELSATGQIARIQASIRHVARAAGYKHYLKWDPGIGAAEIIQRQYSPENELKKESRQTLAIINSISLTDRSDRTIRQSNAQMGQDFIPGDTFLIELIPDAPIERDALGTPPYDIYLYVVDSGKSVHFSGRYYDENGKDRYLDPDGFPWALLIPVDWRWMYERQNIHTAYPQFRPWYTSDGQDYKDWYIFPDESLVAGVPPGFDLIAEVSQICTGECQTVEAEEFPLYQLTTAEVDFMNETTGRLNQSGEEQSIVHEAYSDYARVFRGEHPLVSPA
ncbi:MAG: LruC domain-containing protein, partial [Leptospiraceae bacterium]|nr:LruC domain-containing protein [Leptospiraceae bacterium]